MISLQGGGKVTQHRAFSKSQTLHRTPSTFSFLTNMKSTEVQVSWVFQSMHGTPVRNRLAVRIAGSHPADRGSIPRYGSNHMVFSHNMADERFLCQNFFCSGFVLLVNLNTSVLVILQANALCVCVPACGVSVSRCIGHRPQLQFWGIDSKHGREPRLHFIEPGSPKSWFVEPGSNLSLTCTTVNTPKRLLHYSGRRLLQPDACSPAASPAVAEQHQRAANWN